MARYGYYENILAQKQTVPVPYAYIDIARVKRRTIDFTINNNSPRIKPFKVEHPNISPTLYNPDINSSS